MDIYSVINPLPLLFKAVLHGQKDCVFFSGHLNVSDSKSTLERLGQHGTFKFRALRSVRDGKGLNIKLDQCTQFIAATKLTVFNICKY
jgi:hypothetical protein